MVHPAAYAVAIGVGIGLVLYLWFESRTPENPHRTQRTRREPFVYQPDPSEQ